MYAAASEPVTWYEDEQNDQTDANEDRKKEDHHCAFVHQLADVGFAYTSPVHERIFTKSGESEHRIDGILLRG